MSDHLAIMRNPWFKWVELGVKTIESRVSQKCSVPYGHIKIGDIIYFKQSGDFVVNFRAKVTRVEFYHGSIAIQQKLKMWASQICIDEKYIESKQKAEYCTLMWLDRIEFLTEPHPFRQKGQRAWIPHYNPKEWIE
jgi:ASC-1-like (ASCH) protein